MLYLYIALILLSETAAISFLKKHSLTGQWWYFALALIFYSFVSWFLVKSFKFEEMGIVNVLWSAFSVIMVVGSGILFFKENISFIELIGIGLIVSGVVTLKLYSV
jgi:small multidrug resistance pump